MFQKLNIFTPQDLMNFFEKYLKYGFVYNKKIFTDDMPDFQQNMDKYYKIRLGIDFINHKYGVCWDFCELERVFFEEKKIEHECYFIESYINKTTGGPTHTFLLYKMNNNWYWFEYSWKFLRGIWKYPSKEKALKDILSKFDEFCDKKLVDISLYKTTKVTKRLNVYEFVKHCLNGEKVNL